LTRSLANNPTLVRGNMIRSMTGFARRERQGPWGTLTCEMRTVNHRYLESTVRLPGERRAWDNEIRQAISSSLRRGKVDANIYLKPAADTQRALELDTRLLDELAARIEEVRERLKETAQISPVELLRWPGIVREAELDLAPVTAAALELTREALTELNEMRRSEEHTSELQSRENL